MGDIHEQVDEIMANAMPDHVEADVYQKQRAEWFIEQAKEMHKGEGDWDLADVKIVLMTNPMPGVYSVQFWFVMLLDKAQCKVVGEIFTETRD